jgi:hypothetical protein
MILNFRKIVIIKLMIQQYLKVIYMKQLLMLKGKSWYLLKKAQTGFIQKSMPKIRKNIMLLLIRNYLILEHRDREVWLLIYLQ